MPVLLLIDPGVGIEPRELHRIAQAIRALGGRMGGVHIGSMPTYTLETLDPEETRASLRRELGEELFSRLSIREH